MLLGMLSFIPLQVLFGVHDKRNMHLLRNFKEFMFTSNVVKTSAGYAIGAATADLAKSVTYSLLIPVIQMLWARMMFRTVTVHTDIEAILESMLYWVCVIIVAYVLSEWLFSRGILGLKTTIDETQRKQLQSAEKLAKDETKEMVQAAGQPLKNVANMLLGGNDEAIYEDPRKF